MARRLHNAQLELGLGRTPRRPERRKRGRPPTPPRGVRHRPRDVNPRCPHHVTLRVLPHVWQLRSRRCGHRVIDALVLGHHKPRARIAHYSIQHNHLHLLVEADDRRALATTIQGLAIRIARRLNRVMGRAGRVFAGRFHSRLLKTPTEVRRTLVYVLQNARKHLVQLGHQLPTAWTDDEFSSSPWFAGWTSAPARPPPRTPRPVAEPRTWLLARGWRERGGGPIGPDELPRT